jgi:NodT family efflux transporter outer membrane factor (OMF) lipoprotein
MAKRQCHIERGRRCSQLYAPLLTIALSGCTVGPDYQPPAAKVPAEWTELAAPEADGSGAVGEGAAERLAVTAAPGSDLTEWWRSFCDPQLESLIERAIAGNLELRIAEARIREARAQRAIVAGGIYPTINAGASYSRQHPSQKGEFSDLNTGITKALVGDKVLDEYELYQVGFDASWEIDLFGGVRRRIEAADAQTEAVMEERRDVLIMLVAEVARNYIELRAAQRRLEIAQTDLSAQRATLELVSQKRSAGLVTDLDVTRAAAQVSLSESRIPTATQQIRFSIHALSALLPQDLDTLVPDLIAARPMPSVPREVQVGIPAELLRRRPDIRRAERTLAAATAQIGAATADLYPRFSLDGTFSLEAIKFSWLGNWDSRTFGLGPSVLWPVFDAGRIRANIEVQNSRQEQALLDYERTVVRAIREVEDALLVFNSEQIRSSALADSAESSGESVELAQLAYDQGATDLLAVLDARRELYAAQDTLAASEQTVLTSVVALYKALGGGWAGDKEYAGDDAETPFDATQEPASQGP